jgi:glucose dehydrogenase
MQADCLLGPRTGFDPQCSADPEHEYICTPLQSWPGSKSLTEEQAAAEKHGRRSCDGAGWQNGSLSGPVPPACHPLPNGSIALVLCTLFNMRYCFALALFAPLSLPPACGQEPGSRQSAITTNYRDWKVSGGTVRNIRYSALDQINRSNISKLQAVWTFDTHDAFPASEMECNPIVIDGVLYATSPRLTVIALDAATGRLLWTFDPWPDDRSNRKQRGRGVMFWGQGSGQRIFFTPGHYLYGLDAKTGRPIPSFGKEGRVDLREGLGRDPNSQTVSATSPGVVYKDLLIMGSTVPESLPAAPGDIRAYDVRTGKIRWSFHTIPHPESSAMTLGQRTPGSISVGRTIGRE